MTRIGLTRTMVVWCPDWPVTAAATSAGCPPDTPVAVLVKGRVLASSAVARAVGGSSRPAGPGCAVPLP
jgi:protein ImuB